MVSRVQISLPLLKRILQMQDSFFTRVERKSGIRKELQVVNSVGAWNLPVVDFGGAWAAKSASGLVPV